MKIAVFHNLPSGGAKRALYNSVRHIVQAGHQVDLHVPSTADEEYLPLKDLVSGFHVYPQRGTRLSVVLPSFRKVSRLFQSLADIEWIQKHIAEAINSGPYDVVLSEQDRFTNTPFILKYLEKPNAYYCQQPFRGHEAFIERVAQAAPTLPVPMYRRIRQAHMRSKLARLDRQNVSGAKYILANSYFSREAILRLYGLNSFVSQLGIDTTLFRPLGLPKESFILSVGTYHPHKGFDFVIRALSLIEKQIRPRLVIVGNSALPGWQAFLQQTAAKLDVTLETKTYVQESELVSLYNQARLFVYAAILEPLGLAPLEAMSCGTPVVAVREGGVRETVLNNETGILTERDEEAFAEAVRELLEDEVRAQQMGGRGIEVVRKGWTLEQAGERLLRHLKRAQNLRPGICEDARLCTIRR
jgi:glycosyltransferase involved in cell wall biosynthesis